MTEIWKDLEDFDGYRISNLGRVWSCKSNRFIGWKNNLGYQMVDLFKDGKNVHKTVHSYKWIFKNNYLS